MDVGIDPGGMRAAGRSAHGVARTVDACADTLRSAEQEAHRCGLTGFTTGGALDTFFDTWVPTCAGLSLTLDTVGDTLTSAANTDARDGDAMLDPSARRRPSNGEA